MRQVRYATIAEELRRSIEAGELRGVLPSEAQLCTAFGASRVTVRRALDELRDVGLVDARQGYGWYVSSDPLVQSLARLGTIEAQLLDAGIASERKVLEFAFVRAPARVRRILGVERVLAVRRLNLADGEPFARVTVWCPADLAKGLSLADVERASFYELLDVELGRATQTIGAAVVSNDDAELLALAPGSAVLVCRRTTFAEGDDAPVLHSEHVFAAQRTEFVVDLPRADRSMAPSGLRLVE